MGGRVGGAAVTGQQAGSSLLHRPRGEKGGQRPMLHCTDRRQFRRCVLATGKGGMQQATVCVGCRRRGHGMDIALVLASSHGRPLELAIGA